MDSGRRLPETFPYSAVVGSTPDTCLRQSMRLWKVFTRFGPSYFSAMLGSTADSCSCVRSRRFYGSDCRKLWKFRSCSSLRSSTSSSWCTGRFPWSCFQQTIGIPQLQFLNEVIDVAVVQVAGSLPCRDAEAVSYGQACLADHRDFAVAICAGWLMFLLRGSSKFSEACSG